LLTQRPKQTSYELITNLEEQSQGRHDDHSQDRDGNVSARVEASSTRSGGHGGAVAASGGEGAQQGRDKRARALGGKSLAKFLAQRSSVLGGGARLASNKLEGVLALSAATANEWEAANGAEGGVLGVGLALT